MPIGNEAGRLSLVRVGTLVARLLGRRGWGGVVRSCKNGAGHVMGRSWEVNAAAALGQVDLGRVRSVGG